MQYLLGVFYTLRKKRQVIYFKVRKINLGPRRQKIDLWSSKKCWNDINQQKISSSDLHEGNNSSTLKKGGVWASCSRLIFDQITEYLGLKIVHCIATRILGDLLRTTALHGSHSSMKSVWIYGDSGLLILAPRSNVAQWLLKC